MLKIVTSKTQKSAVGSMLQEIKDFPDGQKQFLLVPDQYTKETQMRLCQILDNRPICTVITFNKLYKYVCDEVGGGAVSFLSQNERLLLMYKSFCLKEGKLKCHHSTADLPAFLANLLSFLDECKQYQISLDQIQQMSKQADGLLKNKLQDLCLILGTYEQQVSQIGQDPKNKLSLLAELITRSNKLLSCQFWIQGFNTFTIQKLKVFEQLLKKENDLTVFLECDDIKNEKGQASNPACDIFMQSRKTIQQLKSLANQAGIKYEQETVPDVSSYSPELNYLKENLLGPPEQKWDKPAKCVSILKAKEPRQEVEYAASKILLLIKDQKLRFRDFIITARHFDTYADLVEDVFTQAGIPFYLKKKNDITEKPVFMLIISALDAVSSGYQSEKMFCYLKTGLVNLEPRDVDRLENYVYTWGINGKNWTKEWDMPPDGQFEPGIDHSKGKSQLESINKARKTVIMPLKAFRNSGEKTGRGYIKMLTQFIEDIKLQDRLDNLTQELEHAEYNTLADEYQNEWNALINVMEDFNLCLDQEKMDLKTFSILMRKMLAQVCGSSTIDHLDQVMTGSADLLPKQSAKYLIILGASEGSFPDTAPSYNIFSDHEREVLSEKGLVLGSHPLEKLPEELELIYNICTMPECGLLVTWSPQAESAGGAGQSSFLVNQLLQLFGPDILIDGNHHHPTMLRLKQNDQPQPNKEMAEEIPKLQSVLNNACSHSGLKNYFLTQETVRALYNVTPEGNISVSATEIERYQSCRFAHFLQDELKIRNLRPAEINALAYGSYVHAILQSVAEELRKGSTQSVDGLVGQTVDTFWQEIRSSVYGSPEKIQWFFHYLKQYINPVIKDLAEEMYPTQTQPPRFKPIALEMKFEDDLESDSDKKHLPSIRVPSEGLTLVISGKIDRIDCLEKDGKQYFLVDDYKTGGRKEHFYTKVNEGILIQLPLYQLALKNWNGVPAENAGMRYIHVNKPFVKKDKDPEAQLKASNKWEGFILKNQDVLDGLGNQIKKTQAICVSAEQLNQLEWKTKKTLKNIGTELGQPEVDVTPNPYQFTDKDDACRFCIYKQICRLSGAKIEPRKLKEKGVNYFWSDIKEEISKEVQS